MPSIRTRWSGLLLAFVLLAGACSSSDDSETSTDAGDTTATDSDDSTTTEGSDADAEEVAAEPCDVSFNADGYYSDADLAGAIGAEHVTMDHSEMTDEEMEGHATDDTATDDTAVDKPNDMSGGLGELEASKVIEDLNALPDEEYQQWLESLDPNRDVAAPDDTGMGGHLGPQTWSHMTDPEQCELLASELDEARAVAAQYPKASDAIAAGYVRVAPYVPGIASHWMNFGYVDGEFEVSKPEMLLYDGNTETSTLVGLSYFIREDGDAEPTVGFTGDNDHYHRHEGLCVGEAGVIADSTTSAEECAAMGGRKSSGASGWMSHAWIVEGCESPWGVFSAQNPILDMSLVEGSGQGEPCSTSTATQRWDLSSAED